MAWIYLFFAGLLEVIWAYAMKESQGFSRLIPSVITLTSMVGSVVLLALSMKTLPLSTSYPIWTGIGAVGSFLVGIFFLAEPISALKVCAAICIVLGVVLLKLSH